MLVVLLVCVRRFPKEKKRAGVQITAKKETTMDQEAPVPMRLACRRVCVNKDKQEEEKLRVEHDAKAAEPNNKADKTGKN